MPTIELTEDELTTILTCLLEVIDNGTDQRTREYHTRLYNKMNNANGG